MPRVWLRVYEYHLFFFLSTDLNAFNFIKLALSDQFSLSQTGNERIVLSSSPSYASTECAEELNYADVDELKMDQMVRRLSNFLI